MTRTAVVQTQNCSMCTGATLVIGIQALSFHQDTVLGKLFSLDQTSGRIDPNQNILNYTWRNSTLMIDTSAGWVPGANEGQYLSVFYLFLLNVLIFEVLRLVWFVQCALFLDGPCCWQCHFEADSFVTAKTLDSQRGPAVGEIALALALPHLPNAQTQLSSSAEEYFSIEK